MVSVQSEGRPKCRAAVGGASGAGSERIHLRQNKGERRLLSARRGAEEPLYARGRVGGEEGGRLFLKGEDEQVMGCKEFSLFP